MSIIEQLSTLPLYLISGLVILFVMGLSVLFMFRAWRAGLAIGLPREKLRRTIAASVTFTVVPSISILLGVIALSGSLGVPLPWVRLSVVGSLNYETTVADIAARGIGLSGLTASEMTLTAFTTIALEMSAGIIWGLLFSVLFNKFYLKRFKKKPEAPREQGSPKKKNLGDVTMSAMFVGTIAAYVGTYVGTYTSTGSFMPMLVICASAAFMGVFTWLAEKKRMEWLVSFSLAGSMLLSMALAVVIGRMI